MDNIDHKETRALLIGTSTYTQDKSIKDIPNVKVNLESLRNTLANTELVGIPESNIMISLDEDNKQIQKKLLEVVKATKSKKSTLLVYYSGHGIMSANDYEMYLTTSHTSTDYLEIEGISIENFKKYIKQSQAGRKILILDCCHSGHILGSMGNMESKLQSEIIGFEGTYVMASSGEDEPSIFPVGEPDRPTHFTGKLIEVIEKGTENDEDEYSSLRDIFTSIESDLTRKGLPRPRQSVLNNADELYFARNKSFLQRKPADELAWLKAEKKNNKDALLDFIDAFPKSKYVLRATTAITHFEETETWEDALTRNTISGFVSFRIKFPESSYIGQVAQKIKELQKKEEGRSKLVQQREEEPVQQEPAKQEPVKPVKKSPKEPGEKKGAGKNRSGITDDMIFAEYDEIAPISDPEEKEIQFEKLEKKYGDHRAVLLLKSYLCIDRKQLKKAEKCFTDLLAANPDYGLGFYHYAFFLINHLQNTEKPVALFQKALLLEPENTTYRNGYASFLINHAKDYSSAEKILQETLSIDQNDSNTHFNLGLLFRDYSSDYLSAKRSFEKSLELSPGQADVQNTLGLLLSDKLNDHEQAASYFLAASNLLPDAGVYYYNYATCALMIGQLGTAETYYDKAKSAPIPFEDKEFEKRLQEQLTTAASNLSNQHNQSPPSADQGFKPDNSQIVAKFAGVNSRKTKDRTNYLAIYGELTDMEMIVRRNSIELKDFLSKLKMNGIISIEYMDSIKDTSNRFNYIKINFSHFENKPILWDDNLTVLVYKYSLWGGSPTKEIYTELMNLVKAKKLVLAR